MKALTPNQINSILGHATDVIHAARTFARSGDAGGYLCIGDNTTGVPFLLTLIGNMPEERARACAGFAQEKNRRLGANLHHRTSWESRDEEKEQYPGAVRGKQLLWSFSGFPSKTDEAAMLVSAIRCGDMTIEEATEIVGITGNPVFHKLREITLPTQ